MEISKELAQEILKILKTTETAVGQATNFATQQIPDIISQLVHWKIAVAVAGIVLGIFLTSFILFFWKYISPKIKKASDKFEQNRKDYMEPNGYCLALILGWCSSCCTIIAGLITLSVNTYNLLQLIFAPKIYLIEYLTTLVQGSPK